MRQLDADNERRRQLARLYAERFESSAVRTLVPRPDCEPVHHVFPIRVAQRDELRAYLDERGIGTGIHYAVPAHLQPALRSHAHRVLDMSCTAAACRELLSLPMYPELEDEQLEYVADQVLAFTERSGLGARSA
ncbi:MAG: DegT/DnrJ/EryC1/StrS family aminotransferase [Myxococcota bacterium]